MYAISTHTQHKRISHSEMSAGCKCFSLIMSLKKCKKKGLLKWTSVCCFWTDKSIFQSIRILFLFFICCKYNSFSTDNDRNLNDSSFTNMWHHQRMLPLSFFFFHLPSYVHTFIRSFAMFAMRVNKRLNLQNFYSCKLLQLLWNPSAEENRRGWEKRQGVWRRGL